MYLWLAMFIAVAMADDPVNRELPRRRERMSVAARTEAEVAVRAWIAECEAAGAAGDTVTAEQLAWQAADLAIRAFGGGDDLVLISLDRLGWFMTVNGDLAGAGPVLQTSLELREHRYGLASGQVGVAYRSLGYLAAAQLDFQSMTYYMQRAVEVSRVVNGETHEQTIDYATDYGDLLSEFADNANAAQMYAWCHETLQTTGRFRTLPSARCLIREGQLLIGRRNLVAGRIRVEQGVAIARVVLPPGDPALVQFLLGLAQVRLVEGRLTEALAAVDEAATIVAAANLGVADVASMRAVIVHELGGTEAAEAVGGAAPTGPYAVTSALARASLLLEEDRPAEAAALIESVRAAAAEVLLPGSLTGAQLDATLGHAYVDIGRAEEGLVLLERGRAAMVAVLGSTEREDVLILDLIILFAHYNVGDLSESETQARYEALAARLPAGPELAGLNELSGVSRWRVGDLDAAEADLRAAIEMYERSLGKDDPRTSNARGNLARILTDQGRFEEAVREYDVVVGSLERALGAESPAIAVVLENYALLRGAMGDTAGAVEAARRGAVLREKAVGADSPAMTSARVTLGGALIANDEIEEGVAVLTSALATLEARDPDDPDAAYILVSLGDASALAGDFAGARPHYQRAYDLYVGEHGDQGPEIGALALRLAHNARVQGLPSAEAEYARAERLIAAWPGQRALAIDALRGHAQCLDDRGDRPGARLLAAEALALTEAEIADLADAVSDRQRIALIVSRRYSLDLYLSLGGASLDEEYRAATRWHGLATRTLLASAIWANPELAVVRRKIAGASFDPDPERRGRRLAELTREKEAAERAIAATTVSPLVDAIGADPCANVPSGTAMVSFLRYAHIEKSSLDMYYVAFVVEPTAAGCSVARVDVGLAAPIDASIERWRGMMAGTSLTSRVDTQGVAVRKAVWDPIAAVTSASTVWVVPDGAVATVPFGGLPTTRGRYLLHDRAIGYLDSPFDAARPVTRAGGDRAVVVGDVDFGAGAVKRSGCVGEFAPLPATGPEATAITAALTGAGMRVDLLTGPAPTQARVQDAIAGQRVVHLATHGFFATEECSPIVADTRSVQIGVDHDVVSGFNPMVLSGLALAGANLRDSTTGEDGLWTAEEVSGLDLRGTDLVVMSACDTGRGRVAEGDSVLGLRRAFDLAGADGVVMSLWAVEDEATRSLMTHFYAELLGPAAPPAAEALRRAQIAVLDEQVAESGEARPWAWAAFVAAGPGVIR